MAEIGLVRLAHLALEVGGAEVSLEELTSIAGCEGFKKLLNGVEDTVRRGRNFATMPVIARIRASLFCALPALCIQLLLKATAGLNDRRTLTLVDPEKPTKPV